VPTSQSLIAFVIASLVIILIPGPSVLFAVGRSLALGKAAGVVTVMGNGLGTSVWLIATVLGLGALIGQSEIAFNVIRYGGAAYLVYLGIQAFRHRNNHKLFLDTAPPTQSKWRTLREGFFVGVSNPKTMVFFVAVLPGFVNYPAGNIMFQLLILGLIFELIGVVSDSLYAIGAGLARDWFASNPKRLGVVSGTGGILIVGLGLFVAIF
jgi:threonine/homoserine/homoserine lactone efflux protein